MSCTDTTGPRGTYGCACISGDSRACLLLRYGYQPNDEEPDRCECLCHDWRKEEDEDDE